MKNKNIDAGKTEPLQDLKNLMRRPEVALGAIFFLALVLRLYLTQFHDVIATDGTSYVRAAKALQTGNINDLATYGFYPVLIWVTSLIGLELEPAGRLVSVFMGSVLVIPVYLLGKEIFSVKTALLACVLTAVWPTLVGWACEVMTQASYITLALSGIYLVWIMMRKPSPAKGLAAGTLLALAFITRPEGLLLFFVMPMVPLIFCDYKLRERWPTLAAYCGSFFLLFGLNMILIYHVCGQWQLSAKTGSALTDALGYYLQVADYAYIPDVKQAGYLDILKDYPEFILQNSFENLVILFQTVLPWPLMLLALWGFLAMGFKRGANIARAFLVSSFAPLAVIIIYYYVSPEYIQQYLPVLFLWAGEGCTRVETFAVGKIKQLKEDQRERWLVYGPISFVIILVFAGSIVARQLPDNRPQAAYNPETDGGRRGQKETGLLLKQYLPPGKIMTRWARVAYYADREWANIPNASLEVVLESARKQNVKFIVVDGGLYQYRPQLDILSAPFDVENLPQKAFFITPDEPVIKALRLRPYLFYLDPSSVGVAVYELVN